MLACRSADVATIREPVSETTGGTSWAVVEAVLVSVVPDARSGSVATGTVIVRVAPAAMLVSVQTTVVCPTPGPGVIEVSVNPPDGATLAAPGV